MFTLKLPGPGRVAPVGLICQRTNIIIICPSVPVSFHQWLSEMGALPISLFVAAAISSPIDLRPRPYLALENLFL